MCMNISWVFGVQRHFYSAMNVQLLVNLKGEKKKSDSSTMMLMSLPQCTLNLDCALDNWVQEIMWHMRFYIRNTNFNSEMEPFSNRIPNKLGLFSYFEKSKSVFFIKYIKYKTLYLTYFILNYHFPTFPNLKIIYYSMIIALSTYYIIVPVCFRIDFLIFFAL